MFLVHYICRYVIFLMRARHRRHMELTDRTRYVFDAFVSYTHQDWHWVVKELLPQLEYQRGIRLCLHQRLVYLLTVTQGYNMLSTIYQCAHPFAELMLIHELYSWHEGRHWPWLSWDYKLRSYRKGQSKQLINHVMIVVLYPALRQRSKPKLKVMAYCFHMIMSIKVLRL